MKRIIIALATVSMVFGFVGATLAADWNFYGSVRTDTFWTSQGKELNAAGLHSRDTLQWENAGNSRFGATVKDNDNLSGAVQFGVPSGGGAVYTRLLYGVYNFGGVKLEIGQDYTPVNIFYSNQVFGGDTDMLDMAMPYDGRHPMIQISANGFELALIDPNSTAANVGYDTTKVDIPKIEAKYTFTVQNVTVQAYGGYQTFKAVNDQTPVKTEQDINAWIGGLGLQGSFGAFYAKGNAYVAQNPADYGLWYDNNFSPINGAGPVAGTIINGTQKSETNAWGGGVVLGYNVNETVSLEAGYGYTSANNDNSGGAGKLKGEAQEYYIQAPITIAKGVTVTPEAGVFDYMNYKTGGQKTTRGTSSYIGAKWQIDF